jgi:hypothetical protein
MTDYVSQYSPGGQNGGVPYPPVPYPPVPYASGYVAQPGGVGAWRSPVAVVLVVLGCLMAPLALAGVWFHANIMEVDGYVATITPVADEPAVQQAVADVLAEQVYRTLDGNQILPGIPGELGSIVGTVGAQQLENLTREMTLQAVSSSAFRGFWAAANRRVHPILMEAIKNEGKVDLSADGSVSLDLVDVTNNVMDLLGTSGVALPGAGASGGVPLLDSRPLARAGGVIVALDLLYWLMPVVTLALLLGSVLVAPRRLLATVYLGVGLALSMAALEAGMAVSGVYYLGVTDDAGIPHEASAAIWRVFAGSLRLWGWAVLLVAVVVALAALAALLITGRGGPGPQQTGPGYPSHPGAPGYPGGPGYPAQQGYPGGPGYSGPTSPPPSR